MRIMLMVAALATLLGCSSGGGGGGGDNSSSLSVTGPDTLNLGEASTKVKIDVNGKKPTFAWEVIEGKTKNVQFKNASKEDVTAFFAKNGTYVLEVTATVGSKSESHKVTVKVDAQETDIRGTVLDGGSASAGVDLDLEWRGEKISGDSTNGSGEFEFRNYIGDLDNYTVVVSGD